MFLFSLFKKIKNTKDPLKWYVLSQMSLHYLQMFFASSLALSSQGNSPAALQDGGTVWGLSSLHQIKSAGCTPNTFVLCVTRLPACGGLGRAHTQSLLLEEHAEILTCGWKEVTNCRRAERGRAMAVWTSGRAACKRKAMPWPWAQKLKVGNQKVMCSNWFQWELLSMLHFKTDYL